MKLLIFGPTGGTGAQLLTQALDAGHDVTIVARNPGLRCLTCGFVRARVGWFGDAVGRDLVVGVRGCSTRSSVVHAHRAG
jgi:hypothetical protein